MIQQALVMGYTASQVLGFIGKKVKGLEGGIRQAQEAGQTPENILKFLEGKLQPKNPQAMENQANAMDSYLKGAGFKTQSERKESRGKAIKGAFGAGAAALTALGAYQEYAGFAEIGDKIKETLGLSGESPAPEEEEELFLNTTES